NKGGPTAIIARTVKGKGVGYLEHSSNNHGKPVSEEDLERALGEIGKQELEVELRLTLPDVPPRERTIPSPLTPASWPPPEYKVGEGIATRKAYGRSLKKLGGLSDAVVVLDGEVKNSTYAELF